MTNYITQGKNSNKNKTAAVCVDTTAVCRTGMPDPPVFLVVRVLSHGVGRK